MASSEEFNIPDIKLNDCLSPWLLQRFNVILLSRGHEKENGAFSDNGQPFTDEDRKCNATALYSSFGGRRTAIGGRSQDKEEF